MYDVPCGCSLYQDQKRDLFASVAQRTRGALGHVFETVPVLTGLHHVHGIINFVVVGSVGVQRGIQVA